MANAKKCDKCGELYEPPKHPLDEIWRYEVKYIAYFGDENKVDLCPDCQERLVGWLCTHSKSAL